MSDVKKVELKRINVLATFKFFGGIFLVIGLIIGLFGSILRIDLMSQDIMRVFPFIARIGPGIFIGIIFAIIYGLSAAIGSSVFALLYNFFAALFGGLKFELKD